MTKQSPPVWHPRPLPSTRKLDSRCRAQYKALHAELIELVGELPACARPLLEQRLLRYEGGGPCLRGPGRSLAWTGFLTAAPPCADSRGPLYEAIEDHMARLAAAVEVGVAASHFDRSTLLAMHASLLPDHPEGGRIRRGPMVLAGHFIAPKPTKLAEPVDELCELVDGAKGPPLLRAALAHAQLVNLHPFCDANGRLARALVRVTLERAHAGAGVLPAWICMAFTALPFSTANAAYRAGHPLPWLALFYRAARSAMLLLRELSPLAKALADDDGKLSRAAARVLLEHCSTFLCRLQRPVACASKTRPELRDPHHDANSTRDPCTPALDSSGPRGPRLVRREAPRR